MLANFTLYSPVGVYCPVSSPCIRKCHPGSKVTGAKQRWRLCSCVANISGFAVQKVELLIKKGVCVE